MSSMRNAVHRRQHRERGQLEGREKWGILEKHKDYSLRAKDYNLKKEKLQRLRDKARDRNPDEFAFGMLSGRSAKQGRHGARDTTSLSNDTVKLLKTQDAGYLRLVGDRVRKEMERVEKDVNLQVAMKEIFARNPIRTEDDDVERSGGHGKKGRKLVFADTREEQRTLGGLSDDKHDDADEEEEEDDDDDEDDGIQDDDDSFGTQQRKQQQQKQQKQTRQQPPSKKQLEAGRQHRQEIQAVKRLKRRAAEVRRNRLEALKKQHTQITAAEQELDLQRGKMTNSVGGVNKHGVKWKIRERKR